MIFRVFAPPAAILLLLAACQMADPPADDAAAADTCGAAQHQGLVGKQASVLDTMRFANPPRVIRPGTMVTMDYSAARLNIGISEAGLVERVYCG